MIRGFIAGEPRFLTADEVLTLHETAIDVFGGSQGIRDSGLLDSAIATARQGFGGQYVHEYPFGIAAAYLYHLCANHPFVDGNKRTALAACITFLRLNGWDLIASEDAATTIVLEVSSASKSKDEIAAWLQQNVKARASLELRTFFQELDSRTLESVFCGIAAGQTPERVATILEAGGAIPAITEANIGASSAEDTGDHETAQILRQHAMLLTAIYRIAEDMGYEW